MRRERTLRARLVSAFTLLALAVGGVFAVLGYHSLQQVEHRLVEARLSALAQLQLQRLERGQDVALPPGLRLYDTASVPEALRALPPGFHDVGGLLTEAGDAVVLDGPDGRRWALVDEQGSARGIERELVLRLALALAASVLLAMLLGRFTAGRVIAPLTALADAVRTQKLDEGAQALARGDEIGVLARALAADTQALRHYLLREQLFTGDVSHELRTPLTVILGAAEVLALQCGDRPAAAAAVERIRRTAQDMAERVSALLLLSRAPQALQAPRIALRPLVEHEVERCAPLLRGKPVAIEIEESGTVQAFAHPELAGMAIGNLLRNACQYTEQGRIVLRLAPGLLSVEDTGPGLPPSVRGQLFERFVRGDSQAAQAANGVGLGLALIKRIVEHLGWRIELEAPEHGGSRFLLRFPD